MSASRQATAAIASNAGLASGEGRTRSGILPVIVLAVLFGALWAAYFAVDAGVDYPEPWAQALR